MAGREDSARDRRIIRASVIAIVTNLCLVAFKMLVGLLANSIAIVLDAMNNLSDALSSVITILGTKLAGRPPDKKHPFGYGRVEYLTGILIAGIILFAGGSFAVTSVKKIITPDVTNYSLLTVIIVAVAIVTKLFLGAFTTYYPYDLSFTLENFSFNQSTGGFQSYLNSIWMSLLTAVLGTAFVFVYACLIERSKCAGGLKQAGKLLSSLPLALPGMVIGLSFIFFFNHKDNPLNFIYGTVLILVLANLIHFYSVPFVTASSALKKLDREYENVSESMRVPPWKTFLRVTVPLSLPAILEIFLYYFMNSMVTVSAVVFLYSAKFKIASIAITHMEEAGDFAQAAAMSLLILLVNVVDNKYLKVPTSTALYLEVRRDVGLGDAIRFIHEIGWNVREVKEFPSGREDILAVRMDLESEQAMRGDVSAMVLLREQNGVVRLEM